MKRQIDGELRMKRLLVLSLLASLAAPSSAARDGTAFTVAETGQGFYRLDDAVKAVGDGNATIVIASGSYSDCAIQKEGNIIYRAARAGSVVFDGGICDGKAALVLDGRGAVVDGIIFENMRVPDRNGSGIRLQKGNLSVINSMFLNSEQGILTHDDPNSTLSIDHTTFSGLGGCPDGMCSHSIYVGKYGRVVVTRTRFDSGTGGHYMKSRAARNDVSDSSFDDTRGHDTNYMIDLPAGSVGAIERNTFVQGSHKENHSAMIAVAAEAREHRSAGLLVANNSARMAPGADFNTVFVADWSHEPIRVTANQLGAGLKPFEQR
jgi:hypothetical protein